MVFEVIHAVHSSMSASNPGVAVFGAFLGIFPMEVKSLALDGVVTVTQP
jgi:hypothetical protein